ncbi:glycosyltransferase family 2 protein, partial [Streptomyces sp. NPDC059627]
MQEPRLGVAVVTMGNRPDEVDALLESVAKQDLAPDRIVIIGNGCRLPEFAGRLDLPGEVTTVEVEDNLG